MRLVDRTTQEPVTGHGHSEMAAWHEWPIDEFDNEHDLRPNVGTGERIASLVGGGVLSGYGISRKSWSGYALSAIGAYLAYRGVTGRCPMYRALGMDSTLEGRAEPRDFFERGIHVSRSITINKPQRALFEYWRDLRNLPRIMSHLKSVEVLDERRSHWVARGPLGTSIEWDAEIINEEPNELIAWRSSDNAEVHNAGSVRFLEAPGSRGTQVRVELEYIPAAGRLGAAIARLFGEEPSQQIREDLRRFKQMMEAGEIASTANQPRGTCKS